MREELKDIAIYKYNLGGDCVTIIVNVEMEKEIYNNDELEWHTDEYESQYLTLDEIIEQLKTKGYKYGTITVWQDSPLHGEIYQYGNYGQYWVELGKTRGYA